MLPAFRTFFLADLQVENYLVLDPSSVLPTMPHEGKSKETNGEGVHLHFHGKCDKMPVGWSRIIHPAKVGSQIKAKI